MESTKTKVKVWLKNDIAWIFAIAILAGLFGKLSNIYDSDFFYWIGIALVIIDAAYFVAWVIISIYKQRKQ